MPILESLSNRMGTETVSNALDKSRKIPIVLSFLSKFLAIVDVSSITASSVDLELLKPYWCSDKMFLSERNLSNRLFKIFSYSFDNTLKTEIGR